MPAAALVLRFNSQTSCCSSLTLKSQHNSHLRIQKYHARMMHDGRWALTCTIVKMSSTKKDSSLGFEFSAMVPDPTNSHMCHFVESTAKLGYRGTSAGAPQTTFVSLPLGYWIVRLDTLLTLLQWCLTHKPVSSGSAVAVIS
jgi:hypothetical protein